MDKYYDCRGCVIDNICMAQEPTYYHRPVGIKECPCVSCLVKVMCTCSCVEHLQWTVNLLSPKHFL